MAIKYTFYFNDHMRKTHLMVIPKIKPGPKKNNKKITTVVNIKAMNFNVITNTFKKTKNEF